MPEVLDLNEQVNRLRARLEALLERDVELNLQLDPALWRVRASAPEAEEMLVNLVVNSRDLLVRGGRLDIATSNYEQLPPGEPRGCPPGRYVRLSASHSGYMTEEVARSLEERALTSGRQGPESSLATVYGFAQGLGGYVWFRSVQKLGTFFDIFLPAVNAVTGAERAFNERATLRAVEEELNGDRSGSPSDS